MNTCSSNIRVAGWNKQSAEPNRTYNPCSIIVCDFNMSFSLILHLHTEKEKKHRSDLNCVRNQIDLSDSDRIIHPTASDSHPFWQATSY